MHATVQPFTVKIDEEYLDDFLHAIKNVSKAGGSQKRINLNVLVKNQGPIQYLTNKNA